MPSKSWPLIEKMRQILKKRSAGHSSAKRWVTWGELLGGKLTTGVWKRLGWRQTVGRGKVQVEGPRLHSTFGQRTFIRSNGKKWPKSLLKKGVTYPHIKHPTRPIPFRMGDPTKAFSLPRATQTSLLKRAMGNSCGMQLSTELSPVRSSGSWFTVTSSNMRTSDAPPENPRTHPDSSNIRSLWGPQGHG